MASLPILPEGQNAPNGVAGASQPAVASTRATVFSPLVREQDPMTFQQRISICGPVKYFDQSVLSYDAEFLLGWGVFCAAITSASELSKRSLLRDVFLNCLLALLIACALILSDSYPTADHVLRLKELIKDLHYLCTFLLGFFVTTCLSRWWSVRMDGIGGLWGAMNDLSMLLGCFFPQDTTMDREVLERVLRWGALSHELIYKQVQQEEDLSDLVCRGFLLEEERQLLQPLASRPQVVWAWMASYFAHLAYGDPQLGGGRLPGGVTFFKDLLELCRKARGAIAIIFTLTDTQVPFRYVHHLCLIVWVHNFAQALTSAFTVVHALRDHDTMEVATECIFLVVYTAVYLGLLHMGAGMLNPMRSSSGIDFPQGAYTHFMLAENRAFRSTQPHGPPIWRGQ